MELGDLKEGGAAAAGDVGDTGAANWDVGDVGDLDIDFGDENPFGSAGDEVGAGAGERGEEEEDGEGEEGEDEEDEDEDEDEEEGGEESRDDFDLGGDDSIVVKNEDGVSCRRPYSTWPQHAPLKTTTALDALHLHPLVLVMREALGHHAGLLSGYIINCRVLA